MEPFTKMAENETAQLQRAIFSQYIMMKKLFMELEEEREASATAASAALSMIRKLQKEKEIERMEAWQYKRIAEERMSHTDRALDIVKEVMQQKELEVYYLRNQLQVYKQRLLNVGVDDCDISDETITKNILLFESKSVENLCHNIKRNFSLPTLQFNKLFAEMDIAQNDGAIQSAKSRLGIYTNNSSENVFEQVYSDENDLKALEAKESLSTNMGSTEKREGPNSPSIGILKHSLPLEEPSQSSPCLVVSHQTDICSQRTHAGEDAEDALSRDPLRASRSDNEMEGIAGQRTDDGDTLKNLERSKGPSESLCTEKGINAEGCESPKVGLEGRGRPHALSKFSATRKVGSMNNVDRHVRVSGGHSTPRAGIERTKSRLKRVQSEKRIELNEPRKSKEQIIMLKEVYEQLNMIEAHMGPSSSQETPRNEQSLDSVMEAALSFSI